MKMVSLSGRHVIVRHGGRESELAFSRKAFTQDALTLEVPEMLDAADKAPQPISKPLWQAMARMGGYLRLLTSITVLPLWGLGYEPILGT